MGNTHDTQIARIEADYIGSRWKTMDDYRWGYCKDRGGSINNNAIIVIVTTAIVIVVVVTIIIIVITIVIVITIIVIVIVIIVVVIVITIVVIVIIIVVIVIVTVININVENSIRAKYKKMIDDFSCIIYSSITTITINVKVVYLIASNKSCYYYCY